MATGGAAICVAITWQDGGVLCCICDDDQVLRIDNKHPIIRAVISNSTINRILGDSSTIEGNVNVYFNDFSVQQHYNRASQGVRVHK